MAKFRFVYMESDDPKAVAELAGVIAREFWPEPMPAAIETTAPALLTEETTAALPSPDPPKKTRRKKRRQHTPIPKRPVKPQRAKSDEGSGGGKHAVIKEQRIAASIAYLRKHGPSRKSHIAKACGFNPVYATSLFRDEQFTEVSGGLVWIAGEAEPESDDEDDQEPDEPTEVEPEPFEDPPPPPANLSRRAKRTDAPTVDELKKAIRSCGPMDLAEVARFTECSEANCYSALQGKEFEKIDGLYWIAK